MATTDTTNYGSWTTKSGTHTDSLEDSIRVALDEFITDYDVPELAEAYRDAINDALPDGVSLCGNEFYGPYPADADLDIAAIVSSIDFWSIAERHDRSMPTTSIF